MEILVWKIEAKRLRKYCRNMSPDILIYLSQKAQQRHDCPSGETEHKVRSKKEKKGLLFEICKGRELNIMKDNVMSYLCVKTRKEVSQRGNHFHHSGP